MKYRLFLLVAVIIILLVTFSAPASATSSLSEAVERVRIEAEYFNYKFPEAPPEFGYALSAMNYTKFHISPYVYDYLKKQGEIYNDIEGGLYYEAGLCGMHTMVFQAIMDELGIENRYIQCFYIDADENTHIFPEVSWNGTWHVFDVTAGAYWVNGSNIWDALSFEEVRNCENHLDYIVVNQAALYNRIYDQQGYDTFGYITSDTVEIVYEGEPVPPPPSVLGGGGFAPVPGYTNISGKKTPSGLFICDTYCFDKDRDAYLYIEDNNKLLSTPTDFVGFIKSGDGYDITPSGMVFDKAVLVCIGNSVYAEHCPESHYTDWRLPEAWGN